MRGKTPDRIARRHQKDLEKHLPYDEMKERKRAAAVRRGSRETKGSGGGKPQFTEDNWEELLDRFGTSRRRRAQLSEIAAELEKSAAVEEAASAADAAIVMSVGGGRCRVFLGGEELDCVIPPHLAAVQKSALTVGDRVVIERDGETARLASVVPRRTVLARPDPLNKHMQRLVAANIDVVVHVVSLKAPPLRPRLIDRYLIAIQRGGAQPVICVNKIDLARDAGGMGELAVLDPYRDLGVPVVACSTVSGEGVAQLRSLVEGKTSALVGHSGVGKSSILNALDTSLAIETNGLHRRGTGRHTTTKSTLYDFGGGTYLIDTPGIREFGLWDLDRESLRDYFPEFEEPSESCRFSNCSHVHEPDCEVKRRVEEGMLHRARYDTYVRLYEDLGRS
jgi:ribosome biogenesis GTPase